MKITIMAKTFRFKYLLVVLLQYVAFTISAFDEPNAQNVRRIAIIETMTLTHIQNSTDEYINAIKLLLPNEKMLIQRMNAGGSYTQALKLIDDLAMKKHQPDLLITVATLATRAAFNKQDEIDFPTVFMSVADPISEGISEAFGTPSIANITGNSHVISSEKNSTFLPELLNLIQTIQSILPSYPRITRRQ